LSVFSLVALPCTMILRGALGKFGKPSLSWMKSSGMTHRSDRSSCVISASSVGILVESTLKKRGSLLGAWVQRYYVLREMDSGYVLSYKLKKTDPSYRGNILMKNFKLEVNANEDPLLFMIEVQSQVIVLKAENVQDFTRWTQELISLSQSQLATNDITRQVNCAKCKNVLHSLEDKFCCYRCMRLFCSSPKCITVDDFFDCPVCDDCNQNRPTDALMLIIEGAEGLAAFDMNGLSDPYVSFTYNDQTYTTSVQHKTLNPVWNDCFILPLPKDDTPRSLTLKVYDHDLFGYHACMGYVRIAIAYLENKRVYASSFHLRTPKDAKRKAKGVLKLKFMKQTLQKQPLDTAHRDFYDAAMAMRASEIVTWVRDIFAFANPLASLWWFVAYCVLCLKLPAHMLPMLLPALYMLMALARLLENLCADLALQKQAKLRKDAAMIRSAQHRWVRASDARCEDSKKAAGPVPTEVIERPSEAVETVLTMFQPQSSLKPLAPLALPSPDQASPTPHQTPNAGQTKSATPSSAANDFVSPLTPLHLLKRLPSPVPEDPLAKLGRGTPRPPAEEKEQQALPQSQPQASPQIRKLEDVWTRQEEKRDIWSRKKAKNRKALLENEKDMEKEPEDDDESEGSEGSALSPFMAGQQDVVDVRFAANTGDDEGSGDEAPLLLVTKENLEAMNQEAEGDDQAAAKGAGAVVVPTPAAAPVQSPKPTPTSKWGFLNIFSSNKGSVGPSSETTQAPTPKSPGAVSPHVKIIDEKSFRKGTPIVREGLANSGTGVVQAPVVKSDQESRRAHAKIYATDEQSISENADRLRKIQDRPKPKRYTYTNVKDLIREIESITAVLNWLNSLFFRRLTFVNRDGSPDINFAEERAVYIRTIQTCIVYLVIMFIVPLRIVLIAWGAVHFTAQIRHRVNIPGIRPRPRGIIDQGGFMSGKDDGAVVNKS